MTDPAATARRAAADTLSRRAPLLHVVTERDGDTVVLRGAGRTETLTLGTDASGAHCIAGRGGRYPLAWPGLAATLAATVAGGDVPGEDSQLSALLADHGFTLRDLGHVRLEATDERLTLYHARHPDGRVVWLEQSETLSHSVPRRQHLNSGAHRLSATFCPTPFAGLLALAEAFEAAPDGGPEPVWEYSWTPRAQAIAALVTDPGQTRTLEGECPDAFFQTPERLSGVRRHDAFRTYLWNRAGVFNMLGEERRRGRLRGLPH